MPEWNDIMSQVDSIEAVGKNGKAMAKEIIELHCHYHKLLSATHSQVGKLESQAKEMHYLVKHLSRFIQTHSTPSMESQDMFEKLTDRFPARIESHIGALRDEWRKIHEDIEKICDRARNFVVPQNNAIWFRKKDTRIIRTEKFDPVHAACGKMERILLELHRYVNCIQTCVEKCSLDFELVLFILDQLKLNPVK